MATSEDVLRENWEQTRCALRASGYVVLYAPPDIRSALPTDEVELERARQAVLGHRLLQWAAGHKADTGQCVWCDWSPDALASGCPVCAIVAELRGAP